MHTFAVFTYTSQVSYLSLCQCRRVDVHFIHSSNNESITFVTSYSRSLAPVLRQITRTVSAGCRLCIYIYPCNSFLFVISANEMSPLIWRNHYLCSIYIKHIFSIYITSKPPHFSVNYFKVVVSLFGSSCNSVKK